ncbi:GA-like domain-containing protein [Staphylococcus nepalensis]|uniref:GA-like domain-containing protein n=1 Tax=Staphylococcus nepalensis TaxID=214473 RepID=UPI003353DCE0
MRIFKEYIARRNNRYSIRKFNIGTASILLGSILIFSQSGEAQADMLESEDKSALNDIDNIDKQVNPDKNEEKNTLINSQTHNESESASISQESNNNISKNVPHNIPNKEDAEDQKVNIEHPNIVHNKPQIEQNQHQNDIKPQENKTGDDVQTEKQIKSSSESNFKQTNKLLNDKENNILSNDNEIEKTSAVKPNVSIKSDIETNDRNNTGENTSKQNVNFTNSSAKVMSFKNAEETTINKNIKTNKENIKQQYPNKPKSRVARSLDRLLYFNNIRKIGYNPKLNYTSVQAGDFITTAIREVEKNRNELTEEERKLFLRNIIRQTVLKNNKFSYDAIFNGNYGIATNKKLNAYQANNINQLLYKMKDLTLNRDNDDYRAVYTFTNQSDVTKNHFGIVQDDIFYDDSDVLIATMVLSKEKGRGTYRFENYAIRPNESLNKKIKKVFAEYEGRERVMLEQDHLGYYSYTRPHSGSNGNPNTGGGSGGTVKFYISFDANHYIDVKKDKLFGYILSDTIDPNVLRGVNITNQSVDIDDVATRINKALTKSKKKKAEQAIEAAEQAKNAVDNKLSEITSDGLINPNEKTELDQLIETLETAKAEASAKLNSVPDGTPGKAGLQTRLSQIVSVTTPEINDRDSNGVKDTEQLSEAEEAIATVEQAKQAVDNKLAEVTSDNLINPSEKAELDQLIGLLESAKTDASTKLNNVPDGTPGKAGLQTRLDQIGTVTLPEVNDQDDNGVLDIEQLSEAEQAIEAAEQAKQAVDNKLSEITSDGLINPNEKTELDQLIETLETAKAEALTKLNNVPNGTPGKAGLQTRLDQIGTVTSPEINDRDSNGVLDTDQLSEAEEAIATVEQAKQAVDNKLAEVTSDNLINPSEKDELDQLIGLLETAKAEASAKLNSVPDGTTGKDGLQTRLDQIDSVTAPEINDQDGNGVLDTAQLSEAEQAIAAVEQAKKVAANKLSEITSDNLVNPSEKAELEKLIETLEIAKTNASEKLNNVPGGTTGKDGLQTRLNEIGTVTAPEVNDRDSNGVLDTGQLSEAEQAITAVGQAKQDVDNKLFEIKSDGLVNPSEKAELDGLIEVLEKAKAEASAKLNSVPDGTTGKDGLQTRLDQIDSVTLPEVNDRDSNGILDTEQLSEAEEAIARVEEAKKAAANKLSEITSDNLVNPSEKAELDQLIEALESAKADALAKLNSVPDGTPGKAGLQTRLDQIGKVTLPEVNDRDSNGVKDTEQLSEAEQAIEAVEQAKQDVNNKLSEVTSDGLVNPSEKAELDQLVEALETAKADALTKLNNVPDGTTGKDTLQTRLDQIGTVTSPEVNDQDSNGVLDTEQLSEAEQAIEAVEEAKKVVDNKLVEITADGLVNPNEKAELDKLIKALETAKAEASTKLNSVPNGTAGKVALQTRLNQIDSVAAPEINDRDSNGVLDTEQLSEAEQAIVVVEESKKAADNKLAEITSDNLVNPSEKAELDQLIEALETAKAEASTKLNNVPTGTTGKDGLQTRLDQIGTVTSPEINDQDGNGVLDTEQLSEAEQAIEAVEQAKIAADNKLSEITADGLVNLDEKAELDQLIEALKTAKANASEKLNNVPDGTAGKGDLQKRLDQINLVTSSSINDKDGNGILDIQSSNIKGQNHAKVNKHLDNTIKNSNSHNLINKNVKVQNLNGKDNTLLNERLHTGLQQLNIVTDHLQIMKNETNESSEHSMNSLTHLPNTGGKNKDSWIFGTLLGAIGSMMILRKRQAKKKDTEKNS